MGSSVSIIDTIDVSLLQKSHNKEIQNYYINKYNLIPSFPNRNHKVISKTTIKNLLNIEINSETNYVDFRNNFPQIININTLPFNPIACVIYCLHYSLLELNLPIFPPSQMYIYRHCFFYKDIPSLLSFEIIFNAIKNYGICSENDFKTSIESLSTTIDTTLIENSKKFRFINIYRIEQSLDVIRDVLRNKRPILIGMNINYKLENISDTLWMPTSDDEKILGGLGGVLVGFIEARQVFIMAQTFGSQFGLSGFVMVPYKFIINGDYVYELYTIGFDKTRVEGYINSSKQVIDLKEKPANTSIFGSLFN